MYYTAQNDNDNTRETLRRILAGFCLRPIDKRPSWDASKDKALALAVYYAGGGIDYDAVRFITFSDGTVRDSKDRRIKAVIFRDYEKIEIARVPIPHWDFTPPTFKWDWYKKYRAAQERQLNKGIRAWVKVK